MPVLDRRLRTLQFDKHEAVEILLAKISHAITDRAEWLSKRDARYRKYRGIVEPRDWPWPGASNFHVPLSMIHVKRQHASLFSSITGLEPLANVIPASLEGRERVEKIQEFMEWELKEHIKIEPLLDKLLLSFLIDGKAVTKQVWTVKREERKELHVFPRSLFAATQSDSVIVRQLLEQLYQSNPAQLKDIRNLRIKKHSDHAYTVSYEEKRKSEDRFVPRTDEIEIFSDDNQIEVEVTGRFVVFEGVKVVKPALEDIIVPVNTVDIETADFVCHRFFLSLDEVRQRMEDRKWELNEEDFQTLVNRGKQPESEDVEKDLIKISKEEAEGVVKGSLVEKPVEVYEVYTKWKVDSSPLKKEVVFVILPELRQIVSAKKLSDVVPYNKRPFSVFDFIPEEGRWFSIGLLEIMEGIQDEITTLHRMMTDFGQITNTPFFLYRAAAGFQPETLRYEPGMGIPVDNVNEDIKFPVWPNNSQTWATQLIALLNGYLERLISQGDIQFGRIPTKATALRSGITAQALIQQGDIPTDVILKRFFFGLADLYNHVYLLNRHFAPPELSFRVLGDSAVPLFSSVTKSDLLTPVEFQFTATTTTTNRTLQAQILTFMFQSLLNPVLITSGVITPQNVYEITREFIRVNSVKNVDRFITKPTGFIPVLPPEAEHQMMAQGDFVSPSPNENAEEHLMMHLAFMGDPEKIGSVPPEYAPLFGRHIAETRQLVSQQQLQAQLAKQAQAVQGAMQAEFPPILAEPGAGLQQQQPAVTEGENTEGSNEQRPF